MASVTRTVYSGGQAVQTITGSDGSVTQRVLESQARRQESQVASNAQEPLVNWAGNGRVKPVGANNAYRPRGVQANTGLGIGDPVQLNGGLVSATPRSSNSIELQSQIKAQAETLGRLAKALAGQFGNGDPNFETTPGIKDVLPRYPDDTYYDQDSGTLFLWDSTNEEWEPLKQLLQGFTGDPNEQDDGQGGTLAIPVYVDGAIAVSDAGISYKGTVSGGWVEDSIEDIDVVIDTGNDTYPIITSSSSRYTVLAITSSGTGTGTLSPAIDAEIAVGGTLNLTLSGNNDTRWSATIRLRRRL